MTRPLSHRASGTPDGAFGEGPPSGRPVTTHPRRGTTRRRPPTPRALIQTSGPDPDTPPPDVRLVVGVLAGAHGLDGELKLRVVSDHPEHIANLTEVYLGDNEDATRLLGVRQHGDLLLIRLDTVTTPEAAKAIGRLPVRAAASKLKPLAPDEYFLYQLIGLEARTPTGESLGTVSDLIETGAHDVLVISRAGAPDLLVPNHPEFVHEIAPERRVIVIEPPVYLS